LANKRSGGGADQGARLTKAERAEEARRKRLEIEQQMAARKRNRTIGIALVVAAVVVVVAVVVLVPNKKTVTPTPQGGIPTMSALISQAGAAAKSAGCDAIVQTPNYQNASGADPDIDHHHIGDATVPTPPALSSYASQPPASGPHDGNPLAAGVYDAAPDVYQTIHSLEHAAVVIWYSPTVADSSAVAQIKEFYTQTPNVGQAKVIVAPYDFPDQGAAGQLPKGVEMAVVAWHRLQTCATPSLPVAFQFAAQHEFIDGTPIGGQTYAGVAREQTSPI
jgi:Protein of unknown function (DUF3105)